MAERRMFAKTIIDSDAFLDMALSTQALYFHLSMRADDDGFINNPKKIMRMIGASQNEIELLLAKNFILSFESGVIVIKHWKIHNYIRSDRYKPTVYINEKALLNEKENKSYTVEKIGIPDDIPVVDRLDTQDRLGKVSIDKKDTIVVYQEIFDYYLSLDLINHKKLTNDMKKGIDKAIKELSLDIEEMKRMLKRHSDKVRETKNGDYPIKVRSLSEFYGQKKFGGTSLICSDYLDDRYDNYKIIKLEKVSDAPRRRDDY